MTSKVLTEILTHHGKCKREGDRFLLPADVGASIYAAVGTEALTIDQVNEVALDPEVMVAVTTRGDRYVVAYEDVRAFRFHGRGRTTGYGT